MANVANSLNIKRNLELSKQLRDKNKWAFVDVYCSNEEEFKEFKSRINTHKDIEKLSQFEGAGYYDINNMMHGLIVLVAGGGKLYSDKMLSREDLSKMTEY